MGLPAKTNDPDRNRSKFARSFERAVGRARWSGFLERAWERSVPTVGGLSAVFLSASWLGLWQNVTPAARVVGVILFAAALVTAARPLFKVKRLTREEALNRMDNVTGKPNRPASTYGDISAGEGGGDDDEVKALWQIQRKRIEKEVGSFDAGAPKSSLGRRDPFGARFALLLVTGVSLGVAMSQGQEIDRVTAAFDWSLQAPSAGPVKVDAWVSPPVYTGVAPLYLSKTDADKSAVSKSKFTVPARSVLRINVHDKDAKEKISVTGGASSVEDSCSSFSYNNTTKCEFKLASSASVTVKRGAHKPLSWRFNVTPDLPPRISVAPVPQDKKKNEEQPNLSVTYTLEDEYDAEVTEGRIAPIKPADPDARPLPLYNLPKITIPVK